MREIELKLAADGGFIVPALPDADPSIRRMEELPAQNLRAVYYDTEDLRLARYGITLRHRSGEDEPVWTLKFPVDLGAVAVRDELNFNGESADVPEEARRLVTAYTRGAALGPVARLRTRRRRWALVGDEDDNLAEIADDEVSVLEGGDIVSRFREIEVETRTGDRDLLERLSHVLQGAGAVVAEPIPKAVRALGARATAPPDVPLSPELRPDDPAGTAVRSALINGAARMISNDPGVRLGEPEAVHQMRVGARRLRSDLRTFSSLVHAYWADDLVSELKWISDLLGNVRDIDVFKENIDHMAADLHDDLKPLYQTLDDRHAEARDELDLALQSDRYTTLLDGLIAAAREPHLTENATRPSGEALPPLVATSWKKLATAAGRLEQDASPESFHKVRIKAKRVRYAAEAVALALGDDATEAKRFAKRVADVQDVLGDHQDALVACDTIAQIAAAHPEDPGLNLAAGRLIERQVWKAKECRASFSKVWGKLDAKKRRKWFET